MVIVVADDPGPISSRQSRIQDILQDLQSFRYLIRCRRKKHTRWCRMRLNIRKNMRHRLFCVRRQESVMDV